MKRNKVSYFRLAVEIVALILFIGLTFLNKLQLWFVLFLAGVIVSLFAGRFFCGWVCPMNTLFRPINWVYKKLKIKRLTVPRFLSGRITRYGLLVLFLAAMVFIKVFSIHINLLLYIVLLSLLLTLIFEEKFWHRHLCPFGTILSLTSSKARVSMQIEEEGCISCGACQTECPSGSIETKDSGKRINQKRECLLCYQCIDSCPKNVCGIGTNKE